MPREATPLPSRLKARARSDPISVGSRYRSYPPATPSRSQHQNINKPSPVRSHRTNARIALQEKLPYFLWQEDPDLSGLDTPRARVVVADRIKKVLQDLAGDPPPLPDPCHEGHPLTAEVCIGSRDYTKAGSYMTKVCVFFLKKLCVCTTDDEKCSGRNIPEDCLVRIRYHNLLSEETLLNHDLLTPLLLMREELLHEVAGRQPFTFHPCTRVQFLDTILQLLRPNSLKHPPPAALLIQGQKFHLQSCRHLPPLRLGPSA